MKFEIIVRNSALRKFFQNFVEYKYKFVNMPIERNKSCELVSVKKVNGAVQIKWKKLN